MTNTRHLPVAAVVILTLVGTVSGQPASRMVSTQWLEEHVNDTMVRIVDMRYGVRFYWPGHIPNAVFLHPDAITLPEQGIPVKLMPPAMLAELLGRMGIDRQTMVVVYAEAVDSLSPYFLWALDYLGHEESAILEGNYDKWKAEGRRISKDYPRITPRTYRLPAELNAGVRASLDDVKAAVAGSGAILLDARIPEQYLGKKGPWQRNGHIPGAINRWWVEDLADSFRLKPTRELRKAYEALGITPDKTIIATCGMGLRSSSTYFVLKYILGYPRVKVYDGSISEWSGFAELPMETGEPQK